VEEEIDFVQFYKLDCFFMLKRSTPLSKSHHNDLIMSLVYASDGSGSKFFDPGQVGSIFVALVGSAICGLGLNLENLKMSNFSIFFPSLLVGSKVSPCWVRSDRVKANL